MQNTQLNFKCHCVNTFLYLLTSFDQSPQKKYIIMLEVLSLHFHTRSQLFYVTPGMKTPKIALLKGMILSSKVEFGNFHT